jgi:hypothetical protein
MSPLPLFRVSPTSIFRATKSQGPSGLSSFVSLWVMRYGTAKGVSSVGRRVRGTDRRYRPEGDMSTPEHEQAANETPNERGAEDMKRRRQSGLAGQRRATADAQSESDADESAPSRQEDEGGRSDADRAKENERKAEEEGRELTG